MEAQRLRISNCIVLWYALFPGSCSDLTCSVSLLHEEINHPFGIDTATKCLALKDMVWF